MVIDIKMCRFENVPWGFRLVGGSDFEYPLTVVKVTEDSIAEEAGLKVGDIIVRINDVAATPLVHDEANKIIKHCGNVFYFGVYRDEPEPENVPQHFPIIGIERPSTPDSFLDANSPCKSPVSLTHYDNLGNDVYLPDMPDRPCSVLSENTEIKLVEEEIAAVLSGESEVLKDHNTIGIFPKPGVCMSSDVLRTLNEEAIKTKAEKDKENKKFTTFLQKPNRPIPKSKEQIEAERRAANAYKVKIVKSAPREPSPAVEIVEPLPQPEPVKEPTPPTPEVEEPPPADSEVPNLEEAPPKEAISGDDENSKEDAEEEEEEKSDKEKETSADNTETEGDSTPSEEALTEVEVVDEEPKPQPRPQKTEEELALERQLADVQRQLAALSSLPSTIQSTLDAVTKQLAELLPTFKLQQPVQAQPKQEAEAREINLEKIDEHDQEEEEKKEVVDLEEKSDEKHEEDESKDVNGNNEEYRDIYGMEEQSTDPVMKHEAKQSKEDTRQMEDEQNLKKQKKNDVIDELEEHLERKNNPKRSKRAFGPLTPSSERPLVLPGGRRWYRPKDAYNDEFIAETLSAQAELITGTTLGVNFMKYQKPERKIDLDRSEVYKVIHHLDRQPVRGIEIRPSVVPAEVDIRKLAANS